MLQVVPTNIYFRPPSDEFHTILNNEKRVYHVDASDKLYYHMPVHNDFFYYTVGNSKTKNKIEETTEEKSLSFLKAYYVL